MNEVFEIILKLLMIGIAFLVGAVFILFVPEIVKLLFKRGGHNG